MCRGKEEKRDQNCPSANQKTQLSFSISAGETQRAALTQWISGLDQNNYRIISSSDNPRLIRLWFACGNGSEGKAWLWACTRCSHHTHWGCKWCPRERSSSTMQKWHGIRVIGTLAPYFRGIRERRNDFSSAQYGVMKLFNAPNLNLPP